MKLKVLVLAAIVALPAPRAGAAADVAAGKEKAQVCAGCHGEDGVSPMPGIPSLAGQQDQYIQWQLVFFRSGRRPNPAMAPLVADLTDEDVRNLGAYYASLPYSTKTVEGTPDDPELAAKGKTIAGQHRCASCHKDDYRGERAAAAIANQRDDYLVKALTDYRAGERPSVGVAAMTEAAAGLSDEDIAAVSHYLATLEPPHK